MNYPKIPLAQSVLQICAAKGLTKIVISPGSRNAPLTIGFASHPQFECFSIVDERCAGFFALGMAQQLKQPVALLCTSGSALLNYYPAFAEAFYSQIPLVVISADRPSGKIDIGDGQTIRQRDVFSNHSLYNANLSEEANLENDALIDKAINTAVLQKGPVHINVPFEEPLYETVSEWSVFPVTTRVSKVRLRADDAELAETAKIWNAAKRKLILVGSNEYAEIPKEITDTWADDASVIVMTEVSSNLHHDTFISNIDGVISSFSIADFKKLQPELLLTFGGMIVSKRIKAFLRTYAPAQHWHIDALRAYNTFGCLTRHFALEPTDFFRAFHRHTVQTKSDYAPWMRQIQIHRAAKHKAFTQQALFSDFSAYEQVFRSLPTACMLQLSNSAAIRYAQLFAIDDSIPVYCNRGTSGIDGTTSTAIGAALASGRPTVLVTGDVSFFYDSNALWNRYIPQHFKIVIVNNSGGGIFRILPGHREDEVFNTFFETSHGLRAQALAQMYGFDYFEASDKETLAQGLSDLYSALKPAILEVFTPEKQNQNVLADYFAFLN